MFNIASTNATLDLRMIKITKILLQEMFALHQDTLTSYTH